MRNGGSFFCDFCVQPVTREQEPGAQLLIVPPNAKHKTPERRWWGHPACVDFYLGSRRRIRESSKIVHQPGG